MLREVMAALFAERRPKPVAAPMPPTAPPPPPPSSVNEAVEMGAVRTNFENQRLPASIRDIRAGWQADAGNTLLARPRRWF